MIDRSHSLPVKRQAKELGNSGGSVYYLPRPVSSEDLAIMRRIDALHLEFPFAGIRMIRDFLRQEGITIGRCHVASLMKKMAIEAVYRRPSTSKPAPGQPIHQPGLHRRAAARGHCHQHGRAVEAVCGSYATSEQWQIEKVDKCRGVLQPKVDAAFDEALRNARSSSIAVR